eukprot:TRINITY_DN11274_c0_g1_i1.p1 TRINITY_DN11274_c0_g1~~TRINITY_DN11274_c0_g1_i1.p1  ORF type:complete len:594 (+),score=68.29 TRINITY_DN11274_c0_g1_i1:159-1940(+)
MTGSGGRDRFKNVCSFAEKFACSVAIRPGRSREIVVSSRSQLAQSKLWSVSSSKLTAAGLAGGSVAAIHVFVKGIRPRRSRGQSIISSAVVASCGDGSLPSNRARAVRRSTACRLDSLQIVCPKTRILSLAPLIRHTEIDFALAVVADPDFPGATLTIVVEGAKWFEGETCFLLPMGACLHPDLTIGQWFHNYLEQNNWVVCPMFVKRQTSQGFLLPLTRSLDASGSLIHPVVFEWMPRLERRFVLELGFVGSHFRGSQVGPKSVLGLVEDALSHIRMVPTSRRKALHCSKNWESASRTDTGVHARCFCLALPALMVSSQDWIPGKSCSSMVASLNSELPASVRIFLAVCAPFSTKLKHIVSAREYRYYLPPATLIHPGAEAQMQKLLKKYIGVHPFVNFTDVGSAKQLDRFCKNPKNQGFVDCLYHERKIRRKAGFPQNGRLPAKPLLVPIQLAQLTTREILEVEFIPSNKQSLACVRMVGTGFLYNMVRLLVGSACAVAEGLLDEKTLSMAILGQQIVDLSEFKAAPQGLVLYQQSMDTERAPWLATQNELMDCFFGDSILPEIQEAWQLDPNLFNPPARRRFRKRRAKLA